MKQLEHVFVGEKEKRKPLYESDLEVGEWFRFADTRWRRDILRKTEKGFVTITGEPSGTFADSSERGSNNLEVVRVELVEPMKVREVW